MRLICKDHFDGETLIEVYLQIGRGMIDGEIEDFDEVYIYDRKTDQHVWIDERDYMDTTYMDLYDYAREYLQVDSLVVEEA